MTNTQIRTRIRDVTGANEVVVKRNGEIHVFGPMPNTTITGWYLYGTRDIVAREFEAEAARK